jgi:hypothetical protein
MTARFLIGGRRSRTRLRTLRRAPRFERTRALCGDAVGDKVGSLVPVVTTALFARTRQLFTLAHEIGHLMAGDANEPNRSRVGKFTITWPDNFDQLVKLDLVWKMSRGL